MEEVSPAPQTTGKTAKKIKFSFLVGNILGALFWIYAPIKLFIFDIDAFLIGKISTKLLWIADYKAIILLSLVCLLFFTLRSTWLYLLFVFFFPVIILLIYLPYVLYKAKSWPLFFTLLNLGLSVFKGYKYTTILILGLVLSIVIVGISNSSSALTLTLYIMILYAGVSLIRTVYTSFKPSEVFQFQTRVISWIRQSSFGKTFIGLNDELKGKALETLQENQVAVFANNLQMAVIAHRLSYLLAHKIEEYKNSKLGLIFNVASYIWLYLKLIFAFSLINYIIYRLDPSSFSYSVIPNFLHFLYYSFYSITPGSFGGLERLIPDSNFAIAIRLAMGLLGYILLPILGINLLINYRSNKENESTENAIKEIRKEGAALEKFIEEEYKLTLQEALNKLVELQAGFLKFIYSLSEQLPELSQPPITKAKKKAPRK